MIQLYVFHTVLRFVHQSISIFIFVNAFIFICNIKQYDGTGFLYFARPVQVCLLQSLVYIQVCDIKDQKDFFIFMTVQTSSTCFNQVDKSLHTFLFNCEGLGMFQYVFTGINYMYIFNDLLYLKDAMEVHWKQC